MSAYAPALQFPSQHHPARDSSYVKLTRALLQATEWISLTTGESLPLSASEKLMWAWMKDRHNFFKSRGGSWYDNQDQIAEATGTGVATVKRWLKKLEKHGYLERKRRGLSNSYVLKADLRVVGDSPRPSPKLSVVPAPAPAPAPVAQMLMTQAPVMPVSMTPTSVAPVWNDHDDDDDLPPPPF